MDVGLHVVSNPVASNATGGFQGYRLHAGHAHPAAPMPDPFIVPPGGPIDPGFGPTDPMAALRDKIAQLRAAIEMLRIGIQGGGAPSGPPPDAPPPPGPPDIPPPPGWDDPIQKGCCCPPKGGGPWLPRVGPGHPLDPRELLEAPPKALGSGTKVEQLADGTAVRIASDIARFRGESGYDKAVAEARKASADGSTVAIVLANGRGPGEMNLLDHRVPDWHVVELTPDVSLADASRLGEANPSSEPYVYALVSGDTVFQLPTPRMPEFPGIPEDPILLDQ